MGRSRSLGQFGTENGGDVHHFVQAGLGVTRGTRGLSGRHGYKHLARSQNSSGSRVAYLAHGPCYGEAIERRVVIWVFDLNRNRRRLARGNKESVSPDSQVGIGLALAITVREKLQRLRSQKSPELSELLGQYLVNDLHETIFEYMRDWEREFRVAADGLLEELRRPFQIRSHLKVAGEEIIGLHVE